MFAAFGRFAFRHRVAIVVVYSLLIPLGAWFSRDVLPMLRAGGFEDPSAESWRVRAQMIDELKIGTGDLVALYTVPAGNVDDVEVLSAVLPALEVVRQDRDVVAVRSMWDTGGDVFVSKDRRRTFVAISLRGDDQSMFETCARLRPLLEQPARDLTGLQVVFGGISPTNQAVYRTIERDLRTAEMLAFPLVAALLVVIFQSLASAALPLLLGACSVAFAMVAMRGLLLFVDVSIFAANTISLLGLGLAIDYSLFLVARFREELHAGRDVQTAVVITMTTTGRAVAFSGVTVLASACGLFAFPQMLLRSVAWGSLAVVAGSLCMAMTLLPALLALLGPRVDAWRIPWFPMRPPSSEEGFWFTVSRAVMRRPVAVVVVVVVVMVTLGVPFMRFDPSLPDHRILPRGTPARSAMELLDTEFLPNQLSAHDVLVTFDDGDVLDPAVVRGHLDVLYAMHERWKAIPGVTRVDGPLSVVDVVGKERGFAMLLQPRGAQDATLRAALDAITEGRRVRVGVVSTAKFNEPASLAQVLALRATPAPPGVHIDVGGVSAILYDLQQTIRVRAPVMIGFVCGVMFLVLFVVFGSVTIPLKAMLMNSLSLTASFGALVWVFQDGRFTSILRYEPLYISDATQPLVLFAVVFGLSMDYEVLLLSRVREEYLRTGDNEASVAHGLSRTGRLITNAASLLVLVVGAFITSEILFMKTLGLGMALAVALDATVIRALLVPATMRLMGDWNWWAPAPLKRWWTASGLGDHGH
jgi:RND superfamily putative drug exporter